MSRHHHHHRDISKEEILQYLRDNEGKIANKDLVKHFKKLLKGSENAGNRATFKEIMNELTDVRKDKKGRDFIVLRAEFLISPGLAEGPTADQENQEPGTSQTASAELVGATAAEPVSEVEKMEVEEKTEEKMEEEEITAETPAVVNVPFSEQPDEPGTSKELEEKKENEEEVKEKEEERKGRGGSVLQKARTFDALDEEVTSPAKILRSVTNEDKCVCASAHIEEETSTTLDEIKRKWMIVCAKCDYQTMARMLQDHHHLAGWKNFVNGYSALHYAAKFGNTDCIKLLAGKHKANVNSITHAGMTPLHLSAMHSRGETIRLLVETYKADPNIRDYRGKLAKEYLNESRLQRSHAEKENKPTVPIEVLNMLLSGEGDLPHHTVDFLNDTSIIICPGEALSCRDGGTLKPGEGTTVGSNSILRRSFRVGTNRPLNPHEATTLSAPEGGVCSLRKGSYGGTLSEKQKEAMVTRSMSDANQAMPKHRGSSQRHFRQQNRVVSMVVGIPEEPSD